MFSLWNFIVFFGGVVAVPSSQEDRQCTVKHELLLVTVATEENDGFKQLVRSTKYYGLNLKTFGLGEEWLGGTGRNFTGGGQKVNILRQGLKQYKNREDLVIMFVDGYDVVLTAGSDSILDKFAKFDAKIVFSALDGCWPDKTLVSKYPAVGKNEKRFLCSGGFIGYAPYMYELINYHQPVDNYDQLYYTKLFLNKTLRHVWKMKLDTRSEIFQNLYGALSELVLKFKEDHSFLYNIRTNTSPIVIHGNGLRTKSAFYQISNYLMDGWTTDSGCLSCNLDLWDISNLKVTDYPTVTLALFVEKATPFIREFFQRISQLDYPKAKMDLYIHNVVDYHIKDVNQFLENTKDEYALVRVVSPSDNVSEGIGRNWAISECVIRSCQYLFAVDSIVQLTNPTVLKDLITQNRSIIAPLVKRPSAFWSNFWGAIIREGSYARSTDYMEIVDYKNIGLWNVPFINSVMLIQGHVLPGLKDAFTSQMDVDPDMAFCQRARERIIFMYVSNRKHWGHLVAADNFDTSHLHNELFDIFNNRHDWEQRYIHPNYSSSLKDGAEIEQPCPDVYWFPIVSDTFCDEFVAEFEHYGQWSWGKHEDPRLNEGYEDVPTVDIHMNQVGLESQWLHFLQEFVQPLQQTVFEGYFQNPPHAVMNFIVRYRPNEQPSLRPHHDVSTYTINIALNRPGIDFQGGGCRFLRYNCSITSPRKGWMFMHPGRLTHFHEGLRTTEGTRYIMISFVDP